ncbi:MAG: protein translocase SEC61 complex subunit gamma [Halobacteriota archaeon]|jgi:protein transport protein SEC61 subunit gamma-like protein
MAKKQRTPSPKSKKQREPPTEDKKREGAASKLSKPQETPTEGRFSRKTIERKLGEYRRILTLTRRPTREEFSTIAKVAALGIVIIGVAGFLIYLAMVQAPQTLANATHATASPTPSSELNITQAVSNATTNNTNASVVNETRNATATSVTS